MFIKLHLTWPNKNKSTCHQNVAINCFSSLLQLIVADSKPSFFTPAAPVLLVWWCDWRNRVWCCCICNGFHLVLCLSVLILQLMVCACYYIFKLKDYFTCKRFSKCATVFFSIEWNFFRLFCCQTVGRSMCT